MNRFDRYKKRYQDYYEKFHIVAYNEALVGQTSKYQAEQEANSVAEKSAMRLLCQTDLFFLMSEIFGMKEARNKGRKIWFEPIHGLMCDELQKDEDSLIHFSRHMLKTTVAKGWAVQKILIDPANVSIGMWSQAADKIQTELKSIKGMLKSKRLLELFPDVLESNEKRWEVSNAEKLTVKRGELDREIPMDEAQIEVFGLESAVTGRHFTYHYYDDLIDDKNTRTQGGIEKARDRWSAIQALKGVDTIEKIVGTPWHQLDLYQTIQDENLIRALMFPGVARKGDGDFDIHYPYFTKKWLLEQERRMGPYLFSCQYLLDTMPRSEKMFVRPYPEYSAETFPEDPKYYFSIDPATGRGPDKTGFCVAAVSRSNPSSVYFVEADALNFKPEQLADHLVDKIVQYKPERVGIEFGLQAALEPLIRLKLEEKTREIGRFPVPMFREIKTGGGAQALNKAQKINRSIGAMVRDQRAFFLPTMRKLFAEMDFFNPNVQKNKDDILDAAGMMIQTIEHFSAGNWFGADGEPVNRGLTVDYFFKKPKTKLRQRIFAN